MSFFNFIKMDLITTVQKRAMQAYASNKPLTVAVLTDHTKDAGFGSRLEQFVHENNGHAPADIVKEVEPGKYLLLLEGVSYDTVPVNLQEMLKWTGHRRADELVAAFLAQNPRFDVSVGFADFVPGRAPSDLYDLAAENAERYSLAKTG